MARVLVTGGTGFIGAVISAVLEAAGHQVRVVDLRPSPAGHADLLGDLRNPEVARAALEGIDAVIHCAAHSIISHSVARPHVTWSHNVMGTRVLLDAMAHARVPVLVNSSTAAVYGVPDQDLISEEAATRPIHAYGRSKLAVEMMIADHMAATPTRATSLRYFNVAGALIADGLRLGERHEPETHLIPTAIAAAAGDAGRLRLHGTDWPTPDGTNIRDYIHVVDLAEAHLIALEMLLREDTRVPPAINVGSGVGYSNREVITMVEEVTGKAVPVETAERRPGDPPRLVASIDLAHEVLKWKPLRDLRQMVADAQAFISSTVTMCEPHEAHGGAGSMPHRP